VLLDVSGLSREDAVERLKELRDRLKRNELDGTRFTIRVTSNTTDTDTADGDAG
jgi:hypothetical protein